MVKLTSLELAHITLEEIQQMKEETAIKLALQKEDILQNARELINPTQNTEGSSNIAKYIRTFYVAYSGVKIGMQFFRSLRKMFR